MATRLKPATTTRFVPTFCTKRGARGAASINPSATGVSIAAAFNGEYPCTNWKYCVSKNVDATSAKNVMVIVADAAEKRGFLKKCTSSIGSRHGRGAGLARVPRRAVAV